MKRLLIFLLVITSTLASAQESRLVPYRKGTMWGYASEDGKIIIEPKYERTYFFSSDGVARIKSNGMYGYLDKEGRVYIIPKYSIASDFYMGVARVEQKKRKFCINLQGDEEECIPEEEDMEEEQEDYEYFTVYDSAGKSKLIVNQAEDTINGTFDRVTFANRYFFPNVNHYALVQKKGLMGAYNEQGVLVAPVQYTKVDILDINSYKALKDNRWGVFSVTGEKLLPFAYDSIIKVTEILFLDSSLKKNDHYIVSKDKKWGVVDSKNREVLKPVYDEIQIPKPCSCPTEYVVKQNGLYGLANFQGKLIIPIKYKYLEPFNSANITLVKDVANREGYLHRNGKEYFE